MGFVKDVKWKIDKADKNEIIFKIRSESSSM